MKRSLQLRLSLMLGGTVLTIGLLATAVTFFVAYSEAKEFQDHTLWQIAVLVGQNLEPIPQHKKIFGIINSAPNYNDPEEQINVYHLPRSAPGKLFGVSLTAGLQTLNLPQGQFRCYTREDSAGNLLAVMQSIEVRDEIALDSAIHVFAPIVVLLPLMTWLITLIIRRELKPLKTLAHNLDEQPAEHPQSLPEEAVPAEVDSFVQAINRLISRVNVLMSHQRRFIADAAHELRSPLTALSLQIQNLETVESLSAMRERIQPLKSGIERARKLTEQLLSLARVQVGESELETIDVSALMRRLIEEYLLMAEEKEIDLGLDEQTQVKIFGAEKNLHLIMKNGLENAIKYTPAGGVVTIRLYIEEDKAHCEVVDNGPGIDNSLKERLFDPFFRPPETEQEGNGLGLAIAREAATILGGDIELLANGDTPGLTFRYSHTLKPETTQGKRK